MTCTPADIIRFAARVHDTDPEQMRGPSNDTANRRARFLAAWGLRFYLKMTHRQISELLGRRGRWAGRYLSGGNSYPKFRQHRSEIIRFVRSLAQRQGCEAHPDLDPEGSPVPISSRSLNLGLAENHLGTASRTDRTFLR